MSIEHPFGPLYSPHSRVLILGSFPSVKSREQEFFYGHPQNRFWGVLAAVFQQEKPQTIEEKTAMIIENDLSAIDQSGECAVDDGQTDRSVVCNS